MTVNVVSVGGLLSLMVGIGGFIAVVVKDEVDPGRVILACATILVLLGFLLVKSSSDGQQMGRLETRLDRLESRIGLASIDPDDQTVALMKRKPF